MTYENNKIPVSNNCYFKMLCLEKDVSYDYDHEVCSSNNWCSEYETNCHHCKNGECNLESWQTCPYKK